MMRVAVTSSPFALQKGPRFQPGQATSPRPSEPRPGPAHRRLSQSKPAEEPRLTRSTPSATPPPDTSSPPPTPGRRPPQPSSHPDTPQPPKPPSPQPDRTPSARTSSEPHSRTPTPTPGPPGPPVTNGSPPPKLHRYSTTRNSSRTVDPPT